jgi:tetratricopeptide (TPR) repeat protein
MRQVRTIGFGICIVLAMPTLVSADTVADCQWATRDPPAVVRACSSLISSDKAVEPWMHFNRGLAYKVLGQLKEALTDYSKAIELNPAFGAAYTNRGNVRLLLNDTAGAMKDFRKAIQLDPKDDVARQNLKAIQAALRKIGADKSDKSTTRGSRRTPSLRDRQRGRPTCCASCHAVGFRSNSPACRER